MQILRYFSRFERLLYVSAFTQKDFHYVHTGPSTKGLPLRNYNYNWEYTTPLSFSTTQEEGTKPNTKQRKEIHLVVTKITNNLSS